ncbi:MAG: hypothetical protein K0Q58_101 [Microbacterium sp.]|nr:hypothetical protein [Microbacterium sp.]
MMNPISPAATPLRRAAGATSSIGEFRNAPLRRAFQNSRTHTVG